MIRRGFAAIALCVCTSLALNSCASLTVNSLPQPGGGRDGYPIVIEFANILNLPERAKVVLGGTTIGSVTSVELRGDHVDVNSRINPSVVVPSNARATLQQSTVLGDIHLALERPLTENGPAAGLAPGGRIPLAQTTSPPQLEDTLANLANFVGSGSIQRMQDSVIGINNVTPANRQELRNLVSRVAVDLADVAANIDTVDQWLSGVSGTGEVMRGYLQTYDYWFSPAGMLGFDRATQVAEYIGTVLPSIGSIYSGGYWLVPMLNSLADAVGAVQQGKWNVEGEVAGWRNLFLDSYLPVDKYPAINITSITGPDGIEMIGKAEDVLRMLGAVP